MQIGRLSRQLNSLVPQLGSEPGQSTVQSHAHRTLAHRKFHSGRLDRVALYGDRLQNVALTLWQALEMHGHLAGPNRLRDGFAGDGFREIVDIDEDAPTASAQRIDQLV